MARRISVSSSACYATLTILTGLIAGCGGSSKVAVPSQPLAPVVTPSASFTGTFFQNQGIVGSANGQAVSRIVTLGNVANAPTGPINALVFGYVDQNGLPTGVAEIATWQTDPTQAVYSMYDGSEHLVKVLQPSTGNAITLSYGVDTPNQVTVTFLKPDGSIAGVLSGTLDANNHVTFQSATTTKVTQSSSNRRAKSSPKGVSIDPDDNPPDGDSDDTVANVSGCNVMDDACRYQQLVTADQKMTAFNQSLGPWAATASLATGSINFARSAGLEAIAALFDMNDLIEKIDAMDIAFQALGKSPASSGVSTDNTGKGLPPYQPTPNP